MCISWDSVDGLARDRHHSKAVNDPVITTLTAKRKIDNSLRYDKNKTAQKLDVDLIVLLLVADGLETGGHRRRTIASRNMLQWKWSDLRTF